MTVQLVGTDPVSAILDTFMGCLTDALAATQAGVPPRMETYWGQGRPPVDSAPMGWVRAVQAFPSMAAFGQPDNAFVPRKQPFRWGVEVELGVHRCVSTTQAAANRPALPSAAEISADAALIAQDAWALRVAVQFLQPYQRDVLWRPLMPIGPTGGVGGVTVSAVVPFNDCKPDIT